MTKWISLPYSAVLFLFFASTPMSKIGAQEIPPELAAMQATYETAKREALKPLKQSYGQALRRKMAELTKAGKLEEAIAFKAEMDRVKADLMADMELPPGTSSPPTPRHNVVDFLEIIDTDLDGMPAEKWLLEEKMLMCVRGSMVPKIILPYEPPEEYDVTMTFEQPRLRNGLAWIIPNGAGSVFSVCAAERGGSYTGLSVGGVYDPRFGKTKPEMFKTDKEYTLTVEVRKESITGKVDGDEIFKYEGDRSALVTSVWLKQPKVTQLAISADDPAVITKLEVTEISGSGKLLRKK